MTDLKDVDQCEHGFVVHDIQGHNHFLCRECGDRFHRHPYMIEQEMFRPDKAELYDRVAQFHDGMITFTEAIEKTKLSLAGFTETLQSMFPPDQEWLEHHQVGQGEPLDRVLISEGPARTSCPQEVEDIISSPDITLTDLNEIIRNTFPDISTIEHVNSPETQQMLVFITFVDGSIQKVVIDEQLLRMNGHKTQRRFTGRRHISNPFEEDRKPWNLTPFQLELLKAKPLTRGDRWE